MMTRLQWVDKLSENDVLYLLTSIDIVLFDIDGCLLHNRTVIPGSAEAVVKLRQLGKKIGFVTNNSVYTLEVIKENLKQFEAEIEEIVTPNASLLAYLEKIKFKQDIYVISCALPKKLLREKGYNVIEYKDIQPTELVENLTAVKQASTKALEICKNVGIVYLELDLNFQYGALQVADTIVNHKDGVELLCGMDDDRGPLGDGIHFIGAKYYISALERFSNRKAIGMAKPSQAISDVIVSKFEISDTSRVLMVGDNVFTDIIFGINSGFKTCLVLSGVAKKAQVEDWKFPEELKPNYVVSCLGEIYEKIKDM